MGVKYYCDGCDGGLGNGIAMKRRTVRIEEGGKVTSSGGTYELCNCCSNRLDRDADPKTWARCIQEAPFKKRA